MKRSAFLCTLFGILLLPVCLAETPAEWAEKFLKEKVKDDMPGVAVLVARDEIQGRFEFARSFFASPADRTKQLKKFEKRGKTSLSKTEKELKARREKAADDRQKAIERAKAQVTEVRETVGSYAEKISAPITDTYEAIEKRFQRAA